MHPLLNPVRAGVIMLMEQCSETKKLRNVRRRNIGRVTCGKSSRASLRNLSHVAMRYVDSE